MHGARSTPPGLAALAVFVLAIGGWFGGASLARADVVGPCPPGFQASHSGCRFGPNEDDFMLCGGCGCVIIGLGTLSALLLFLRKGRASGPREG